MINLKLGVLLVIVGSILGIYSIYEMRIKNRVILPSLSIVFVHFFIVFGVFLITKNPSLGFVAMIFYNIVFIAELISYVLRNKNVNLEIENLKRELDEEILFWKNLIYENHKFVDDYELFEHILRVDKIIRRAKDMDMLEITKPLLNFLKNNKNYFKNYKISEISEKIKIPKECWWFYLDKLDT
ncbi:MAG: hypothetical protein ABIL37_00445 [candidate division WOR-3 bacterium]